MSLEEHVFTTKAGRPWTASGLNSALKSFRKKNDPGFHEAINRWWVPRREDFKPAEERDIGMRLLDMLQGILQPLEEARKS